MSLEQDVNKIFSEIARSFPVDPIPDPRSLVSHDCEECAAVQRVFAGKKWAELSVADLEQEPAALSLLDTKAYAYYIAAHLSSSVVSKSEDLIERVLTSISYAMRKRP